MMQFDRRSLLKTLGLGGAALALPVPALAQSTARIVIVGGGFGGATAAQLLAALLPIVLKKLAFGRLDI